MIFSAHRRSAVPYVFVKSLRHKGKWSNQRAPLENREASSWPDVCSGIIYGYLLRPDIQKGKTEKDQALRDGTKKGKLPSETSTSEGGQSLAVLMVPHKALVVI